MATATAQEPAVLTTRRLSLRPVASSDLDVLHTLWMDADVRRYLMDGKVVPRKWAADTVARSIHEFATGGLGLWVAIRPTTDDIIGFCGLRADAPDDEIGLLYGIAPPFWGQGLATEVGRAMLAYGFETLKLTRIVAGVDAPNTASLRVLDKLGFHFERNRPGAFGKTHWYAMSNEAFAGSGKAG